MPSPAPRVEDGPGAGGARLQGVGGVVQDIVGGVVVEVGLGLVGGQRFLVGGEGQGPPRLVLVGGGEARFEPDVHSRCS